MTNEKPITPRNVSFILSILIPLLALAISWGVWTTRVDSLESRLAERTAQAERADNALVDIKIQLAEIKTDLVYIRKQVEAR